jgi:hypothetical protein
VRQARTADPTEPTSALTTEMARRVAARTTVLHHKTRVSRSECEK